MFLFQLSGWNDCSLPACSFSVHCSIYVYETHFNTLLMSWDAVINVFLSDVVKSKPVCRRCFVVLVYSMSTVFELATWSVHMSVPWRQSQGWLHCSLNTEEIWSCWHNEQNLKKKKDSMNIQCNAQAHALPVQGKTQEFKLHSVQ